MPEIRKVKRMDGEVEAARIRLNLTPEEVRAIQRAADATYQSIGQDLEPSNKRLKTISREELIEVVLDANYMDYYGFGRHNPKTSGVERALRIRTDHEALKTLLRDHFTCDEYEVGS